MTARDDIKSYLRGKRRSLATTSFKAYTVTLTMLGDALEDEAETMVMDGTDGTEIIEQFLEENWGTARPRTYNKHVAILRGFTGWCVRRQKLRNDPMGLIDRARVEQSQRSTFNDDERRAIFDTASSRDRVALRLLLDYGLRKGALQAVKLEHFDVQRRRLTIFTKGAKVRELPVDAEMLADIAHEIATEPGDTYLLHRRGAPNKPMSSHALHVWWYARLVDAGVVPEGTTSGRKMHSARHTAGQRVLDKTSNLKAAQTLLGHASISTTGDVYAGWSDEQLEETMREVLA